MMRCVHVRVALEKKISDEEMEIRESLIASNHAERICYNLKNKRAARRRRDSMRDAPERINQSPSALATLEKCSDERQRDR